MKTSSILLTAVVLLFLASCKDNDDATPSKSITPDDRELITTVKLNFSNGTQQTYVFSDPDGDGGTPPTIDTIRLNKGEVYHVEASFFDESNPADIEDITQEIKEKAHEHIICFEAINSKGLTIERTDTDGIYEVGLTSMWTVNDSANSNNGELKLTLKHQVGVKDGSCEAGETDVEVNFPLSIE